MTHDCRHCGESFRTLSRKRLHDCPADKPPGPEEWKARNVEDEGIDEIAEQVADELLTCVHCGRQIEEEMVGEIEPRTTAEGVSIVAEFDCPKCGGHQRNTAELT
jgi:DNA-directed RNA polymerase subunit RPC12/RpoP